MAKKNGKSFTIGGLPIYHLICEEEAEHRPLEAYGAAAAKDQAAIVYRAAAAFVSSNPILSERLKIIDSTRRIIRRDGRGFYTVISADGDVQDGVEPSLAIFDELHRWKTPKASGVYTVLMKGMISRNEPLGVQITTRGAEHECPLWEREDEYAQLILDGTVDDPTYFAMIYSADSNEDQRDPNYWKSRKARTAANPSHEDHGGFLTDEAISEDLRRAESDPSEKANFKRFNLNLKVNMREERAIDMDRWRLNHGGEDLRTWPFYDYELLVRKWGLQNRECWAGVDLSTVIDLTALSFIFPPWEDQPLWTILPFVWMPEECVIEREKTDRVPYRQWIGRGFVETTLGASVDYGPVRDRILWGAREFDLREVCFDPYNARDCYAAIEEQGIVAVDVIQSIPSLTAPTKRLIELYLNRLLRHANNPVLNFAASCLSIIGDKNDNIKPAKPERQKSGKRIDPISATITAMARAVAIEVELEPGFRSLG